MSRFLGNLSLPPPLSLSLSQICMYIEHTSIICTLFCFFSLTTIGENTKLDAEMEKRGKNVESAFPEIY